MTAAASVASAAWAAASTVVSVTLHLVLNPSSWAGVEALASCADQAGLSCAWCWLSQTWFPATNVRYCVRTERAVVRRSATAAANRL